MRTLRSICVFVLIFVVRGYPPGHVGRTRHFGCLVRGDLLTEAVQAVLSRPVTLSLHTKPWTFRPFRDSIFLDKVCRVREASEFFLVRG